MTKKSISDKQPWLWSQYLPVWKSLSAWDKFRMELGIFFLGYTIIIFIIPYAVSGFNLNFSIIGLGIALFVVGLYLIFSVDLDLKNRTLQNMIYQLK